MKNITRNALAVALAALTVAPAFAGVQQDKTMPMPKTAMPKMGMMETMRTSVFQGPEVNTGIASLFHEKGKHIIRLSPDFQIPKAPAPHFQVVDADGSVYLLQRLTIVGGKTHREVVLPSYIKSVAKVQIYCSFAEVVLGEAKFDMPVSLR